jgi:RNA polymerase sigma-70 factor (ECF subfamily)
LHWAVTPVLQACIKTEPEVSDETLAARAHDGARSAFMELVMRHQDRVYRLALRMCRNEADAEEIAQETMLLAHRGIASFHGESRFVTWLYRIAVNQVLMRRRGARRRPLQSIETAMTESGAEAIVAVGGEPPEGADELLDRKTRARRVRAAMATLDESHRVALVLRDLEELSSEEAGEILGVSPDAVRQRAHRARLRLRELLRGELAGVERTGCD